MVVRSSVQTHKKANELLESSHDFSLSLLSLVYLSIFVVTNNDMPRRESDKCLLLTPFCVNYTNGFYAFIGKEIVQVQ